MILETAAQLLEQHGLDGFNTNRLAARSGVSVGTIYQYFADKRAVLLALAEQEQERVAQEIRALLMTDTTEAPADQDYPRARAVVRAMLHISGDRQRTHRVLTELALQAEVERPIDHPMSSLATLLASEAVMRSGGGTLAFNEVDAFVLTRAVIGSIRAALICDARLLRKPQYENALVSLMTGFAHSRAL